MSAAAPEPDRVAEMLPGLLEHLAEVRPDRSPDDQDTHLHAYLDGLFDVGRLLTRHPDLAGRQDMALFRQESAALLAFAGAALSAYVLATRHALDGPWHDDEGLDVARRRSALAFLAGFVPMYAPDTTRLDERLAARWRASGGIADPADVPAGVPGSHWWWRDPEP
jgi:hypothetical protein